MATIQSGNLLDVTHGIITHQVNCKGVMGAGLAKSLRNKYPSIYPSYRKYCLSGQFTPGMVQFIKQSESLYVCNLAGQYGYGVDRQHTNYRDVAEALPKLYRFSVERSLPVYIPYLMGCNLGGGDWITVLGLIEKLCPNAIILKR